MLSAFQHKKKKKDPVTANSKTQSSISANGHSMPMDPKSQILPANEADPSNIEKSRALSSISKDMEVEKKEETNTKPPGPTQVDINILELASEAGIHVDTVRFRNAMTEEDLKSVLDQIVHDINEAYKEKIKKENESTAISKKSLCSIEEKNNWITETCSEINQKLQKLQDEVKSDETFSLNRPLLRENLKLAVQTMLNISSNSEMNDLIPGLNALFQRIKRDNHQLCSDINNLSKMYDETAWKKQLRKRAEKCFDTGDATNLARMKVLYTDQFRKAFPGYSDITACSDDFVIACNNLAKSYAFPPEYPKHDASERSSTIDADSIAPSPSPSSVTDRQSPTQQQSLPGSIVTLKSNRLPPLNFSNKESADAFLHNFAQAKAYFNVDAKELFGHYVQHRTLNPQTPSCSCLLCLEASKHPPHVPDQCSFCNVHQHHGKVDEKAAGGEQQECCSCGNCLHFSHYIQGLRFLTHSFGAKQYTASRSGSIKDISSSSSLNEHKEKKKFNIIGGIIDQVVNKAKKK